MSHCIRRLKPSAECVIIIPGFSSIFPETWDNSAKTVCVCLLWNRYDKRIWKLQSAIGNTSQIKATRLANLPEKSNAVVGFNPSHIFVAHIPISIYAKQHAICQTICMWRLCQWTDKHHKPLPPTIHPPPMRIHPYALFFDALLFCQHLKPMFIHNSLWAYKFAQNSGRCYITLWKIIQAALVCSRISWNLYKCDKIVIEQLWDQFSHSLPCITHTYVAFALRSESFRLDSQSKFT